MPVNTSSTFGLTSVNNFTNFNDNLTDTISDNLKITSVSPDGVLILTANGLVTSVAKSSANTASTIVQRDASGNAAFNVITGNSLSIASVSFDGLTVADAASATNVDLCGYVIVDTANNCVEFNENIISENIIPDEDNTWDIGSGSKYYRNLYINDISVKNDILPETTGISNIGSSSYVFNDLHIKSITLNTSIIPVTDGDADLGSVSKYFDRSYIQNGFFDTLLYCSGSFQVLDSGGTDVNMCNKLYIDNGDDNAIEMVGDVSLRVCYPNANNFYDFGTSSKRFKTGYFITGDINTLVVNTGISSDLIPSTNNTYDLGSSSFRFSNVYSQNVDINTLTVNNSSSTTNVDLCGLLTIDTNTSPNTVKVTSDFHADGYTFFVDASNNKVSIGAFPTTEGSLLIAGADDSDKFQIDNQNGDTILQVGTGTGTGDSNKITIGHAGSTSDNILHVIDNGGGDLINFSANTSQVVIAGADSVGKFIVKNSALTTDVFTVDSSSNTVSVDGHLFTDDLTASNDVDITGNLDVTGDLDVGGDIDMYSASSVRLPTATYFERSGSGVHVFFRNDVMTSSSQAGFFVTDSGVNAQMKFFRNGNSSNTIYYIQPIDDYHASSGRRMQLGASGARFMAGHFYDVYTHDAGVHTSDERLKENIQSSALGLDFINQLTPRSYKWKDQNVDKHDDDGNVIGSSVQTHTRTHYGLIAQEVKTVMDNNNITPTDFAGWIENDDVDQTQGLRYSELIAPMIKAIQELKSEVDTLRARVDVIESQ